MPHAKHNGNGSEPKVPNPELNSNGGRPPVMSDAQLQDLTCQLNHRLGRPPKAAELIEAAGGCQKKRALAAIQALTLEIARNAVRSELVFPRSIESSLRGLMADWLEHAASQLASRHQTEAEQFNIALDRSNALIDEQRGVIGELREAVSDRDRTMAELTHRISGLSGELARALEDKIRAESVAAERERLIAKLTADPIRSVKVNSK